MKKPLQETIKDINIITRGANILMIERGIKQFILFISLIMLSTLHSVAGNEILLQQNTASGDKMPIKEGQSGAQSFKYNGVDEPYQITKVVLYLSRDEEMPKDDLHVSIGTGVHSGTLVHSEVAISVSDIPGSEGKTFLRYEISYPVPVGPLNPGTTYYINMENNGVDGKEYFVEYAGDDTYPNGTYYKNSDDDAKDMRFEIYGGVVAPTLTTLSLESNVTTLNIGEKAALTVNATYSDGSTKELDTDVEYIATPLDTVAVNGNIITAKKDSGVAVQAKVGTTLSNTLNLTIVWIVDGHVLPPEPDPVENAATLGGIDSNNNGVRDDVERKIYEKYPVRLQRALLLDGARVFQEIAVRPVAEAQEIVKEVTRVLNCKTYLRRKDERIRSYNFELVKSLENLTYDSKERVRKYLDYNLALSGGSYGGEYSNINENACTVEIVNALKELGL